MKQIRQWGRFLLFHKRPKNVASLLRESLSKEMLDEPLLLDHVKIEDYLMVALEIRPCSLLTIPAEFHNGTELGRRIDELCAEDLQAVLRATTDKKGALIRRLKKKIREALKRVVFTSATYEAHMNWSRKLDLRTFDVEVRPSIHELYLFKDSKIKSELRSLMRIRTATRERVRLRMDASKRRTRLAFAEESSPEYLVSVGKLLGYPSCCVERYVHERLNEGASVEARASGQVEQSRKDGEEPDVYAYFVRNFFPCRPTCENASEIGRKTFDLLSSLDPKLGGLYGRCMTNNVEMVEECPGLTKRYRAKLTKKAQRLTRTQSDDQNNFKRYASINWDC
ncbi:MAG: DUF483 domain-containing protein [Candidatus Bathyarchaeota archaeon]|nr:MAG: DUF483 domain-containing protein [Candidatus Bathyarchaeota archaeon]